MTKSVVSVTIDANKTTSDGVNLGGLSIRAIEMPAAFSGTTITFESTAESSGQSGSDDFESWKPVYDDAGNQISVTVGTNRIVGLTAAKMEALDGLKWIRIVAAGQNPGRIIRLICMNITG